MVLKTIELKVGDFMTSEPIAVSSDVLFPVAVSVMANNGIGNLIIKENNKPNSLLTEREILSYLVRRGEIPIEPMKNVLTQSFTPISPNMSLLDAAKLMISKKKRLLVFENEKLVGIITASDMLRGFRKTGGNPTLDKVKSTKIHECAHTDSIFKAIKLMYQKRIGSVIITKNDIPYGIFTERDLLVNVLTQKVTLTERVGDYCSSPLVTSKIGIRGNDAARLMASKKIKRLALTEKDKIVGIVTARDIVEAFYAE
jgi:predicted transcriptional regulator